MIAWPNDLVSSLARRRAVIFMGAGVSMNSVNDDGAQPPSWHEFLKRGIARCPAPHREMRRHLNSGDYLTCCQLIKYKLGAQWVNFVEEEFLDPQFKPAKIHGLIFDMDASIVLTPNFDVIYDRFAQAKTDNHLRVKHYYDEDIVRAFRGNEKQRLILKVHGSIDTPDKLVFTREDYAAIRYKYANFYRAVEALIITHTFLFVGCGMNDPDLSLILEQYAYSFAAAPPHYLVTSKKASAEYERMLENNYNVHLIRYSPKNDHAELHEGLEGLGKQVENARVSLAEKMLW